MASGLLHKMHNSHKSRYDPPKNLRLGSCQPREADQDIPQNRRTLIEVLQPKA